MKHTTIIMAFAVILFGCQDVIEKSAHVEESAVFNAEVESFGTATRTSMDTYRNILWSDNDQLAIFQGSSIADKYRVTDETVGTVNGKFTQISDNSGEVGGDFNSGVEIATNIALYPYADGLSVTNATMDGESEVTAYEISGFVLPATQTYATGSFGNGSFPMVAVTETLSDHTLKFKNVLGAMKLSFKGAKTVKSIKIEGKNSEKLSGAATITAYQTGYAPAITMSDNASTSVTLDCGEDGVTLSESAATDFVIALPPVLFSQGFAVIVTYSDDTTKTIETTTANTVLRSSVLTMPTLILADDVTEDGGDDSNDSEVNVLEIIFDKSSLILAPTTSYSIVTVVVPSAATNKILTWSSSNPTVATIDGTGKVTAISDGTATITAVAKGGASKSCIVTVISLPTFATATVDYEDEYGVNHGKGIVVGPTVWAPVNCGYKAATDTDKGYPYGKLYQWGRKYGQGYSTDYDATAPTLYYDKVSATVGQDKALANYFFYVDVGGDWVDTKDDAMWNGGTEESPKKDRL